MARVQIVSDLHTEFWGEASLDSLDSTGVDVLVVAGDLTAFPLLETSLERVARRYSEVPVVYVLGNHELYDASPARAKPERPPAEHEPFDGHGGPVEHVQVLAAPRYRGDG